MCEVKMPVLLKNTHTHKNKTGPHSVGKSFENGTLRVLLIRIVTIVQHLLCAKGIVIKLAYHFLISILGKIHKIGMFIPMFRRRNKTKKRRDLLLTLY